MNPTIESLGYGTTVVRHLIDEAALLAFRADGCHDVLYLDVYLTSEKAIHFYTVAGFVPITPEPIADTQEDGRPYIVMAKRVKIASA